MTQENEPKPNKKDETGVPVTGMVVNFEHHTLTLVSGTEPLATVRLASTGVIFHDRQKQFAEQDAIPSADAPAALASGEDAGVIDATTAAKEKVDTVTLNGRLKSTPRAGRPDSKGSPTAWARFAAHEEGKETAHMYSATFHKHTAEIALRMAAESPLTVQAYPHENDDPASKRMDTLSVINVLDYPGKEK